MNYLFYAKWTMRLGSTLSLLFALNAGASSPDLAIRIEDAGSGCEDLHCLWITGSNFDDNVSVIVKSNHWTELGTYTLSAGDLVRDAAATPQVITLRLRTPIEEELLDFHGLIVTVVSGDGQTWASRQIVPNKLPELDVTISSVKAGCTDGDCLLIQGTGISRFATVIVRDNNWKELGRYFSALGDHYVLMDRTTTPRTLSLKLVSTLERALLNTSGLIITVESGHGTKWANGSIAAQAYVLGRPEYMVVNYAGGTSVASVLTDVGTDQRAVFNDLNKLVKSIDTQSVDLAIPAETLITSALYSGQIPVYANFSNYDSFASCDINSMLSTNIANRSPTAGDLAKVYFGVNLSTKCAH